MKSFDILQEPYERAHADLNGDHRSWLDEVIPDWLITPFLAAEDIVFIIDFHRRLAEGDAQLCDDNAVLRPNLLLVQEEDLGHAAEKYPGTPVIRCHGAFEAWVKRQRMTIDKRWSTEDIYKYDLMDYDGKPDGKFVLLISIGGMNDTTIEQVRRRDGCVICVKESATAKSEKCDWAMQEEQVPEVLRALMEIRRGYCNVRAYNLV